MSALKRAVAAKEESSQHLASLEAAAAASVAAAHTDLARRQTAAQQPGLVLDRRAGRAVPGAGRLHCRLLAYREAQSQGVSAQAVR